MSATESDAIIRFGGVGKVFTRGSSRVAALHDVTLDVRRGEVFAVIELAQGFGVVKAHLLEPSIAITATNDDRDASGHLANPCELVERHRAQLEVGFSEIHAALGC